MKRLFVFLSVLLLGGSALMMLAGNPAYMLRDRRQLRTVESLTDLGEGRLYRMDYKADYRLQDFLDAGFSSQEEVKGGVAEMLLDFSSMPIGSFGSLQPACSAFQAVTPEGEVLYGRNFDYDFEDGASVLIRTRPKRGYRSMGLVSMNHVGLTGAQLADGETDLSMLVAAPYAMMDGINEKGFAVSVLALTGGDCARQYGKGKPNVMTIVLMRLLLDRAATVEEALELCQGFNFFADGEQRQVRAADKTNYHFLLSDAGGRSVVLEYVREDGYKGKGRWVMQALDERYVTNFYLAEGWREVIRPDKRYARLEKTLTEKQAVLTEAEAMDLLQAVSQKSERKGDVRTQWSVVYNLSRRTATICPGGDYSDPVTISLRPRDWR
jgi:choloylglycine hydrolase